MTGPVSREADALVAKILSTESDLGEVANDLLKAFFAGYPVDRLRLLLRSSNASAVRAGVWIASELGGDAAAMAQELPNLLDHAQTYVRFFAVDVALASATSQDGEALGKAVALIDDPEESVRWKVLHFLARASNEQLAAALPFITREDVASRLSWLLGDRSLGELAERFDGDRLDGMFAVAAASRLTKGRQEALRRATASDDAEVRTFAEEELGVQSK